MPAISLLVFALLIGSTPLPSVGAVVASPLLVTAPTQAQAPAAPGAAGPQSDNAPKPFNELLLWYVGRYLGVLVGGFAIFLGYRLFILGVTGKASLSVQSGTIGGQVANAAPGLFFAIGGIVIVAIAVWGSNPK
jgi:hypothetical protein